MDEAPILVAPRDRTLREGHHSVLFFGGRDPDGEPVTFTRDALSDGAVLVFGRPL